MVNEASDVVVDCTKIKIDICVWTGSFAASESIYQTSTWPPVIYDITCTGAEASIWDCSYSLSNSGQACGFDAAIVCQGRSITFMTRPGLGYILQTIHIRQQDFALKLHYW